MNQVLPKGWFDTKLGSIIDYGKAAKKTLSDVEPYSWILELEDIEKDSSKLLKFVTASERPFKSTKNTFKKGDVLYGKLRPYLNKVIMAIEDGVCTTEIIPINSEPYCLNKYMFYWLKCFKFLHYVDEVSHGVNMPRLGTSDGKSAPFRFAPLAEQQEIVAQLDKLLAQVKSTKNRLDVIPAILKSFRQSVLAAAVSGKLTEEWRGTLGKTMKEWRLVSLGELVVESANGLSKRSGTEGDNITILRLADFKNGIRVYGKERKIKLSQKEQDKYGLLHNDILVIRVNGSVELAGRFIEYHSENNTEGYCDHFIRLRTNDSQLSATYLTFVANNGVGRAYLKNGLSTSAGQNTINQGTVKGLKIALPTRKEQTEIVHCVEELFDYANKVEAQVNAAQKRVNNLTQSLLCKAFSGELTAKWRAQNPDLITGENSAAALLEKIKAERSALAAKKKPAKKTTARKAKA